MEPNLRAEKNKDNYLKGIQAVLPKRAALAERSEAHASRVKGSIEAKEEKIKDLETEMEVVKKASDKAKQAMPTLKRDKTAIERAMENAPADVDFAAFNERTRETTRLMRDIDDRREQIRNEIGSIGQHIRQHEETINRAENERASLNTQAGQQANKLRFVSKDAHKAWEWIQQHQDRFRDEIYGPPIVTCSVKDPHNAAAVESALGRGEMIAFTATSLEDYRTLADILHDELRLDQVNIRQSSRSLDSFRPPMSAAERDQYGLDGWMLDLLEGPEPVLAMLCDNRAIHATAFASRELTNASLDALKGPRSPISSWVTPTQTFRVARRREYGDNAVSVRTSALKRAQFFTETSTSNTEDPELEGRVASAQQAIEELTEQKRTLQMEDRSKAERRQEVQHEEKEIREEKAQKQAALAEFQALPTRLQKVQEKLDDAQKKIESVAETRRKVTQRGDQLTLERGQLAIDYANAVNSLRDLIVSHMEAQILEVEAKNDLEKLKERTQDEKRQLDDRRLQVKQLEAIRQKAKDEGVILQRVCRDIGDAIAADELLSAVNEEIEDWDPAKLELEIESMHAKLEMNDGAGGQQIMRQFEERGKRIAELIERRDAVGGGLTELDRDIARIKDEWEPRLDELVGKISGAFAENFGKIQCAGEVSVHKDEDFELWSILIKVKFRYAYIPNLLVHMITS